MYMLFSIGSRLQVTGLMGVRFLRFNEGLQWGQLPVPHQWEPVYVIIRRRSISECLNVQNNLVGFQVGSYVNHQICGGGHLRSSEGRHLWQSRGCPQWPGKRRRHCGNVR